MSREVAEGYLMECGSGRVVCLGGGLSLVCQRDMLRRKDARHMPYGSAPYWVTGNGESVPLPIFDADHLMRFLGEVNHG